MSDIWFSSDEHYDHARIIDYCDRPYNSIEGMQEAIIANHNSMVKPTDTVYHLGDFCLDIRNVVRFATRLNGKHHLIPGNHDACHPRRSKHMKARAVYENAGFIVEPWMIMLSDNLPDVVLSHMPYRTDGDTDQRYPEWRPEDEGGWLLCGHVHEKWLHKNKMINVGVDKWDFMPVNIDIIKDMMR